VIFAEWQAFEIVISFVVVGFAVFDGQGQARESVFEDRTE
jgi:hypothetical protein